MASYPVKPDGTVVGAPASVQKQFDELMGENQQWARANQDKIAAANSKDNDKEPKKDKKRW